MIEKDKRGKGDILDKENLCINVKGKKNRRGEWIVVVISSLTINIVG